MTSAIKWYVQSNLHIALCAVIFLIGGYATFQVVIDSDVLIFVGVGTWMIYLLHRYIGGKRLETISSSDRFEVALLPDSVFYPLIGLGILISAWFFFRLPLTLWPPLVVIGAISTAYIAPLFGGGRRLRDIGHYKIFLIAAVWAGVFILPFWMAPIELSPMYAFIIWIEKACFIFALTLPFDIRDRHLDDSTKVSTLASLYDDSQMKRMIVIGIVASSCLAIISYFLGIYPLSCLVGLQLSYLLQCYLSMLPLKGKGEYYYLLILDSVILCQGLLHWLAF